MSQKISKFQPRVLHGASDEQFKQDVLNGLSASPKTLPSKYFYDARGSRLFERICEQEEYYLTRTETAILQENQMEISGALGPDCLLIEPGSGSSLKTRVLLDAMESPAAYIPVEISPAALVQASSSLQDDYPKLEILPVCADFSENFPLPLPEKGYARKVIFYPGSSIGNFHPEEAVRFLSGLKRLAGSQGGLLIGFDLVKDRVVLEAAYNDRRRVTAAFNLNLLERVKHELGAVLDPYEFKHWAYYDEHYQRIEMHLVSSEAQEIYLGGKNFQLGKGETILTEVSYKYTLRGFEEILEKAGFAPHRFWTDSQDWFGVCYAVPQAPDWPNVQNL